MGMSKHRDCPGRFSWQAAGEVPRDPWWHAGAKSPGSPGGTGEAGGESGAETDPRE